MFIVFDDVTSISLVENRKEVQRGLLRSTLLAGSHSCGVICRKIVFCCDFIVRREFVQLYFSLSLSKKSLFVVDMLLSKCARAGSKLGVDSVRLNYFGV